MPHSPRAFWAGLVLVALAIAAGLAVFMHHQQQSVVAAALREADNPTPARPLADITSAVQSMKLVTVEIDTKVKVERGDTSWRGDVSASLEVPVRLHYGTDLSKLSVDSISFSTLAGEYGGYVVRVPPPTRIATEIFGEQEAAAVKTGWMRLRSRAGEYWLGQARKDASGEARELELLPEDAERVRRVTREQVEALVRSIVGDKADVAVVIEETPAPGATR
jgi:hypothetical protein